MGIDAKNLQPLISIIIPVFNVKDYLAQCLDSVVNQTYPCIEVFLIDDGSTDGSESICDGYAEKYPNVYVKHFKNAGLSEARNRGLRLVNGDYVMFVDSDDWIEPDTCELAARAAVDQNADVVIWSYVREYPNRSLTHSVLPEQPDIYIQDDYRRLYLSVIGPDKEGTTHPENLDTLSSTWNKLYKTTIAADISFIDLKIISGEDLLYNICYFGKAQSAVYLNRYFYHYRKAVHSSITHTYSETFLTRRIRLFEMIKDIVELNGDGEVMDRLYNRIALDILGCVLVELTAGDSFFKTRKRVKRNILCHPVYAEALSRLDISCMPFHWKLFYRFGKRKNATMLCLMGKAVRRLKRRV